MPDDATSRALVERLETAVTQLSGTVTKIEIRDAADYERFKALDARLTRLEAWQTWTLRAVVGLVLIAVVGLVLT